MRKPPHKDDIWIGEDRWIEFGKLADDPSRKDSIDELLAPVLPFLDKLETECVAACCGIDAFNLGPEQIVKALATLDAGTIEKLPEELTAIQNAIESSNCDTVVSHRLNQLFRKEVFVSVIEHLRTVVALNRSDRLKTVNSRHSQLYAA